MKIKYLILVFIFCFVSVDMLFAQCAMCKAVVETDLQAGTGKGAGINNGIIYLMVLPYLLAAGAGYFIYKHYKKTN